jgi:hypothetical protein
VSRLPPRDLARTVLGLHPQTLAEELGLRSLDTASASFRLLIMALLMSARIRASVALNAVRAVFRQPWKTPQWMGEAPRDERARVLNEAGCARYDQRTLPCWGRPAPSSSTGTAAISAGSARRPATTRRWSVGSSSGSRDVGVDVFLREAQGTWSEVSPFADRRARQAAWRLGLDDDTTALTCLAGGDDFVRLVTGLVRVGLADAYDDVIARASERGR